MIRRLLVVGFLASFVVVTSAGESEAWTANELNATVAQFGGVDNDDAYSVAVDSLGNSFVAGTFSGATDFDPGVGSATLTSNGGNDAFVVKLNSSGEYVWAKQFGSLGEDSGFSVTVDSSGNVLVSGYFAGVVDFDPGVGSAILTSNGYTDVFVVKLNSSGEYVWAKRLSGSLQFAGRSLTVDSSGNSFVAGTFSGATDFDPGVGSATLTSNGGNDAFVVKLNSSGGYLWAKQFGGTSYDDAYSVAVDSLGNSFVAGTFSGATDFDPGVGSATLTSNGGNDAFVVKLNSSGEYVWAKQFGSLGEDSGFSVTVDSLGNSYVLGKFQGLVDFDPGVGSSYLNSNGWTAAFVVKLNSSGGYLWAKQVNGYTQFSGRSIAVDSSGSVLVGGYFWGYVSTLSSNGGVDAFVVKLNSSGEYVWAKQFGGTNDDSGFSVTVDSSGNILFAGYFAGVVDFDPGVGSAALTSKGAKDAFVVKLNSSGESTPPTTVPPTTVPVTTVPVTTVPVTTVPVTTVPVTTVPVRQVLVPATTIPFVMLPSEPRNVKVTRKSPNSLTVKVSWSRPIKSEGNLWYRVYPSEWVAETGCTTFKLSCEFKMWPGEAYSIVVKAYNINGVASTASRKAKKIVAPLSRLIKGERQWPPEARDDQGSRCSRAAVTNGYRWPVKEISGFRRLHSTCNGKVFFISNSRFSIASVRLFEREIPGQLQPGLSVSEESIVAALDLTGNDERLLNRAVSSIGNQLKKLGYYVDRDGLYPLKSTCVAQRNDLLPVVSAFWPSPLSARNWGSFDCRISGYKKEFERNFFGPSFGERKPRIDFKWTYDPVNCKRKPCEAQPNGNGTLDLKYLSLVIRIS